MVSDSKKCNFMCIGRDVCYKKCMMYVIKMYVIKNKKEVISGITIDNKLSLTVIWKKGVKNLVKN